MPIFRGRKIFNPDYLIWMNTVEKGKFPTFDKTFQKPTKYDFKVVKKNAKRYARLIEKKIKKDEK